MPKPTSSIPPADLVYAVDRLIADGKTTAPEVLRLAGERVQRIAALEAELKALTGGSAAPAAPGAVVSPRKPTAAKAPAEKAKAAKKPLSPKLRAFRRVQGLYAGYLRGFKGAEHERIRAINAEKGAAAALAEMRKLLKTPSKGAKAAAKKAPAARKAAAKASRKLTITPERKAALRIHGTYIGLLRGLPKAEQGRMKALAAKSGMGAAVEVMRARE